MARLLHILCPVESCKEMRWRYLYLNLFLIVVLSAMAIHGLAR